MYNLTDKEFEKYTSSNLFRSACERAYQCGLSKEEMLSELAITLINNREEQDRKIMEEMMLSTKPHIFLNN